MAMSITICLRFLMLSGNGCLHIFNDHNSHKISLENREIHLNRITLLKFWLVEIFDSTTNHMEEQMSFRQKMRKRWLILQRKWFKIVMHSVPKNIACNKSSARNTFGINDICCARRVLDSKLSIFSLIEK